jgi:hypothetical protein
MTLSNGGVCRHSPFRQAGQGVLDDLGGNLHRADLAAIRAEPLGQEVKSLAGGVAHRHFGMPYPARIGGPAGPQALAWHEAGLATIRGKGAGDGSGGMSNGCENPR